MNSASPTDPLDVIGKDDAAQMLGIGGTTFERLRLPQCPWARGRYLRGTLTEFKRRALAAQIAQLPEPATAPAATAARRAGPIRLAKP